MKNSLGAIMTVAPFLFCMRFDELWFYVMDELGHVLDERAGAIAQYGLLGGVGSRRVRYACRFLRS